MSAVAKAVKYDFDHNFDHAFVERSKSLEQLIASLRKFAPDSNRDEFSRLFQEATFLLELDDTELAMMFKVSRPTIGRWARGESAPHPLGREPVFHSLIQITQTKLRRYLNAARAL